MPTWHSVHFGCRPAIMSALRKDNKETWCANSDVYPQAASSAAPGPETPVKSYPGQCLGRARRGKFHTTRWMRTDPRTWENPAELTHWPRHKLPHHLALEGGPDVVGVSLKHSSGSPRRGGLSCRAIVWCERLDLSSLLNIHGFANANPQSILVVVQRPRTLPPGRQSLASSCLNRAFPITLRGPTRMWYNQLKPTLISLFDQLAREFELNFLVNARLRPSAASLLGLSQGSEEALAQFIG
ncbi:hypothetical protein BHM03_00051249 [Ensete ventricosum]|nr:hypothetical protein BHM03_00051249 [Ensete ventricosum]